MDPLGEALGLLARARTQREKLRALDSIRASTSLLLKAAGMDGDPELLTRLDENIQQAQAAFREQSGFESALYALAGYREAVRQRIAAVRAAESVEVVYELLAGPVIGDEDSQPRSLGVLPPFSESVSSHFAGVPRRFVDPDRFQVHRAIRLAFRPEDGYHDVKVYERSTGALVWASGQEAKDGKKETGAMLRGGLCLSLFLTVIC